GSGLFAGLDNGLDRLRDFGEHRRLRPGLLQGSDELLEPKIPDGDRAAGDGEPAHLVIHLREDGDAHDNTYKVSRMMAPGVTMLSGLTRSLRASRSWRNRAINVWPVKLFFGSKGSR